MNLGSSTLIETSNMNMLFDLGIDEKTGVNPLFSFKGDLNYLIISHPHKDHISGLSRIDCKTPEVFGRNNSIPLDLIQKQIKTAQTYDDKILYEKYLELNKNYNYPVQAKNDPCNPDVNGGLFFKHYLPLRSDITDLNYYSISTFIEYEGAKILLMGDNTKTNIEELLDNHDFLENTQSIDLLLAPHHGRFSCYKQELMDHLKPKITIISDKSNQDEVTASNKYSSNSCGVWVLKNGNHVKRRCLTTRNDGNICALINNGRLELSCE
ncbi:ComEC/Rec2 family competence protein [uncultured Methanobrevibacter sp.]|uniref:ComEC/Rec2 family competence protein n=1 Tax=uncultured Methanobrevibacter sp. TaxID=253161 RepID=UPI00262B898E|nr:MBL fold metallo-hydrolase [uncultured Methanobrevibacter sp.]